jgi:membrane protease YdiL (CAAX protease family)
MNDFPQWIDHLLAFFYGLFLPWYSQRRNPQGFNGKVFNTEEKKLIYRSGSISLLLIAVAILTVWYLYSRPWRGLGFTAPLFSYNWIILAGLIILLYLTDSYLAVSSPGKIERSITRWKESTPFLPENYNEFRYYLILCLSAGVFEEIIYRGFLVTYCLYFFAEMSHPEIGAVVLPAITFSTAHYYQGYRAVVKIFLFSVLFGFIFVYSGSLWVLMIIHFLIDAAGGLLTIRYLKERKTGP